MDSRAGERRRQGGRVNQVVVMTEGKRLSGRAFRWRVVVVAKCTGIICVFFCKAEVGLLTGVGRLAEMTTARLAGNKQG